MKRIYLIFFVVLGLIGSSLYGQERRVTGTVTQFSDGSTLPGVTVRVQGTSLGTITDMNGRYEITVPSDAVLVFTYIGMNTEDVPVNNRDIVDVAMVSDVSVLQEIVVTALGISRERKALGFTVQEVGGQELARAENPNIMTALSGKVAGIEVRQSSGMPGAPSTVLIRGARSFSGTNTPLYVIDGLPVSSENDYGSNVTGAAYANRALDINPADIESITVLKGQAASALYGMRASNGVIVITTKRGTTGKPGKPVVNITSGYTLDNISRLPEVQQSYAQGFSGAFAPANSFSWGPRIEDLPNNATYGGNNNGQSGMFFDPYKGTWVTPQAFNNPANFYNNNGFTFNNNISVSQATGNGNFSMGLGSTNQTGFINETGMDRYTGRFAGDFKLAEMWGVGFTGNYVKSDITKLPSGNDSWLFTVYGAPPSFDLAGTPFHQEGDFGPYRQISYRRGAVGKNPYWVLENNEYREQLNRFFGNAYVEFKPTSFINVKYQLGADSYTNDNFIYQEAGQGDLPSAAQYPTPANPNFAVVLPTGGSIDNFGLTRTVINSLLTANINFDISEDIGANLLLGNEIDHNTSEFYTSSGSTFTTPGWANLNNTNTKVSAYTSFARRTVGFFGNIDLNYKALLFLSGTVRGDVVSSMPRDNRTFIYPAVNASFVFTELGPLVDNPILPFGKIRLSYAEVGQAASTFLANPPFVTGGASSGFLDSGITYPWQGITGYKPSATLYDPNLVPQNTRSLEFGIDLSFLNNRVGIDYTYFDQFAKDQIFAVPMAGSTGYASFVTNAGQLESIGHEVVLKLTPVDSENFTWNFNTNFTKITNTVLELAEGVENIALGGYVSPNIRASAGDTYPAIYGEMFLRDDQGRILVDEDPNSGSYGFPLSGGFGKIGDVAPDFIMSFVNDFIIFKNLNVFAQVEWKQGGQIYSGTNRLMNLYGTSKVTEGRGETFIYDGYLSNGQPNNIERGGAEDPNAMQDLYTSYLDAIDEAYILGTSFIKLREVGLNVNIPARFVQPIGMTRASIGFVARNILLWSELDNFDPETSQGQGNMQGGMDYMSLPQVTNYGVTVNVTF